MMESAMSSEPLADADGATSIWIDEVLLGEYYYHGMLNKNTLPSYSIISCGCSTPPFFATKMHVRDKPTNFGNDIIQC
jgi:hypothetical protein